MSRLSKSQTIEEPRGLWEMPSSFREAKRCVSVQSTHQDVHILTEVAP